MLNKFNKNIQSIFERTLSLNHLKTEKKNKTSQKLISVWFEFIKYFNYLQFNSIIVFHD